MHYYGTRLSENISRREPEGYLLCLNVPVARTGTQDYLPEELGLPGSSFISVYRPEEEVFSPETIASFEGMPVTNDHPPDGVDVSNIRALQKGHAHNVRRGTGDESDLLLADLIITDPGLIDLILEEGKREISCGYTYELCEENANMKKSLSKILARMAKDGDIETVAEIIEEMIEPEAPAEAVAEEAAEEVAEAVAEVAEEPAAVVETPEGATIVVDEDTLGEVISRLDQIIALLTPAAQDEDPAEEIAEAVEEAIEAVTAEEAEEEVLLPEVTTPEEISEMVQEILDPVSEVIEAEEDECEEPEPEVLSTGDALRAALRAVGPALAKMPRKQRQRVCADIAARLNGKTGRKGADAGIYAALAAARRKPAADPKDLGRRIMEKRSANRAKT